MHIPDEKRKKLDNKAVKGVFMGYPDNTKGYKVYDVEKKRMFRSRDVIFMENSFENLAVKNEEPSELLDDRFWKLHTDYFTEDEPDVNADAAQPEVNADAAQEPEVNDGAVQPEFVLEDVDLGRPQRNVVPPDRYGEWEYGRLADSGSEDPKTYKQAMSGENAEDWKKAADEEYSSLLKNETWELVDPPVGVSWL